MTLHEIDRGLTLWINDLSENSIKIDMIVKVISENNLPKGVVVMMMFWGIWFSRRLRSGGERETLIATLLVSLIAIFVGRALALMLPFRLRPIHSSDPEVNIPFGIEPVVNLGGWSSMPSDHAVLFFALATGFFMADRRVGALALIHAAAVVSAPRVILGLHYVGDIVIGALIGMAITLALLPVLRQLVGRWGLLRFEASHPHLFYPVVFLFCFQNASMFASARQAASQAVKVLGLGS